jgi:hypothetical protein
MPPKKDPFFCPVNGAIAWKLLTYILYIGFIILFYYLYCIVKGIVDGVNGTDKNLLIRYSARELKEAMDSIDNDEKRFAAHSVNEQGKEFSLAEECARLLRIIRHEGVKSEGKYKKREDARDMEHREWLVWLKQDKVSELKYSTVGFSKEA